MFAIGGMYIAWIFILIAFSIVAFVLKNIMMWNSFLFSIIIYNVSNDHIHTGLAFLSAFLVFGITLGIQYTKKGFLVIGGLMSIVYGVIGGYLAYDSTDGDWIWTIVIGFVVTIIFLGLHFYDKTKYTQDVDVNINK